MVVQSENSNDPNIHGVDKKESLNPELANLNEELIEKTDNLVISSKQSLFKFVFKLISNFINF